MITAKNYHFRIGLAAMVVLLATGLSSTVFATSQMLRCEINEGDETYIADFLPTSDPYAVVAKNIGERFRLKVVMLGNEESIEYIKIYTYYKDPHSTLLLHIGKYVPPFVQNQLSFAALTGVNYVYSPGLERELQYGCAFFNVSP
jgi:hypothetical protein